MPTQPDPPCLLIRAADIEAFERGDGVVTLPYVGRWNSGDSAFTTGRTRFPPGTGLLLHTHNVEESVVVVSGDALAVVGDDEFELVAGDATWVPAGVAHRFANRGSGPLEIYWTYGGRYVTRTICETGETFEHLSERDRTVVRGTSPEEAG